MHWIQRKKEREKKSAQRSNTAYRYQSQFLSGKCSIRKDLHNIRSCNFAVSKYLLSRHFLQGKISSPRDGSMGESVSFQNMHILPWEHPTARFQFWSWNINYKYISLFLFMSVHWESRFSIHPSSVDPLWIHTIHAPSHTAMVRAVYAIHLFA